MNVQLHWIVMLGDPVGKFKSHAFLVSYHYAGDIGTYTDSFCRSEIIMFVSREFPQAVFS